MPLNYNILLCIIFLLLKVPVFSQPAAYKNLVLEGGGIRGIAYGGALTELEERNILPGITRIAGTSAGAIQAALLAVGYTPQEITDITFKTPIQKLSDGRLFFLGGFPRLVNQFGWYRGEKFRNLLEDLIYRQTGKPNLTFAQLHALAEQNQAKDLFVTGTSLTRQKAIIFSYQTYPDMKISDAVRISMSIPVFFRAVIIDSEGNVVKKPKDLTGLDVMVDGGIIANYPIQLFDEAQYLNAADQAAEKLVNSETLGIRLDTDEQISYDKVNGGLAPHSITNFKDYIGAFYAIVIEQLNRQELKPEDWSRTISVSTQNFSPKIKRLTEKDKAMLLASGRQGVQSFFKK